jgi:predicted O-methyltransferase YrrM
MITESFFFIRIPRTGGTSVERSLCLGTLGRWFPDLTEEDMDRHLLPGSGKVHQHTRLVDCLVEGREVPPFRFTVVRNPWSLVISEIAYFKEKHTHFTGLSWKESIRKLITEPAWIWGHSFQPQITWLLNERGEPAVDFVARTERLDEHFAEVCSQLALNCPPLERELSASHGRELASEIYDEESRGWVAHRYAADIAIFGYEFPEAGGDGCGDARPLVRQELIERYRKWRQEAGHSVLSSRCALEKRLEGGGDGKAAAAKYEGKKEWGWYLKELPAWQQLLGSEERVRAMEIGAFDGVSGNLMLDYLFTHPESELHVIDPFEKDPATPQVDDGTRAAFLENARRGGHGERLRLYEGLSVEVLAWMLSTEGYWESFDFIYIDGSHLGRDVLTDAVMSWNLLKPGGIIAFDDYEWQFAANPLDRPKAGIDAFSSVFEPYLCLLSGGWRRIWQKVGTGR